MVNLNLENSFLGIFVDLLSVSFSGFELLNFPKKYFLLYNYIGLKKCDHLFYNIKNCIEIVQINFVFSLEKLPFLLIPIQF